MYALIRWWRSPARAAGYDYNSSRNIDGDLGSSSARQPSRRATRVLADDDASDHSLCDRRYLNVVDEDGKSNARTTTTASAPASVNSGLEEHHETEGIALEGRLRSVGSVR